MFLGTHHNKLRAQTVYGTIAVEETYNLFNAHKKLSKDVRLPIDKSNLAQILDIAKSCLLEDPTVLRIKPRIHVIGNLNGNYNRIWQIINTNEPTDKFLFLGDYINSGLHSLENITLLLCMKILAPKQVFLLRGIQETPEMSENCGFKNQCTDRYDEEIYSKFLDVFECFPLAAILTDKDQSKSIFFLNGGISPNLFTIQQLDAIQRPIKNFDDCIAHEILFSEPNPDINNFSYNKSMQNAYFFGKSAAHHFLKSNHIDQIITSRQKNNFLYPFDDDRSVISIYSAKGVNMLVREDMLYTLTKNNNRALDYRNNNVVF